MKQKNNNKNTFITLSKNTTPTLTDPGLWSRIQARHAGLAADLAFVGRLRAEGALDEPDPKPLILEYLRFAYLAWTDPAGATPSKAVDEAWHAHILHTRSYAAFCEATRGAVLHHDPGGGESDEGRFREAYRRTLARYAAEFGDPPGRYWPRPAGPPEEIPKPEPPRAVPKPPPPAARRGSPIPFDLLALAALLVGVAAYLTTASVSAALLCGFLGGSLGILAIAQSDAGSPRPDDRPLPRTTPASRPPRPAPPRPARSSGASRRSPGSSTTSGGDAGAFPVLGADASCPTGSHGHSGHSGGHGDGGGHGGGDGGSSCSGGSSCGGGGCGGA